MNYINLIDIIISQGVYLIDNTDSSEKDEIQFYQLLDDFMAGFISIEINENVFSKMKEIQKIKENKRTFKRTGLFYRIQFFFTKWYCGIIGDDRELKALKSDNKYTINKIITQLNGIKYYLSLLSG